MGNNKPERLLSQSEVDTLIAQLETKLQTQAKTFWHKFKQDEISFGQCFLIECKRGTSKQKQFSFVRYIGKREKYNHDTMFEFECIDSYKDEEYDTLILKEKEVLSITKPLPIYDNDTRSLEEIASENKYTCNEPHNNECNPCWYCAYSGGAHEDDDDEFCETCLHMDDDNKYPCKWSERKAGDKPFKYKNNDCKTHSCSDCVFDPDAEDDECDCCLHNDEESSNCEFAQKPVRKVKLKQKVRARCEDCGKLIDECEC